MNLRSPYSKADPDPNQVKYYTILFFCAPYPVRQKALFHLPKKRAGSELHAVDFRRVSATRGQNAAMPGRADFRAFFARSTERVMSLQGLHIWVEVFLIRRLLEVAYWLTTLCYYSVPESYYGAKSLNVRQYLECMPIHTINGINKSDRERHPDFVSNPNTDVVKIVGT